jgi:phosphoglycerol transferase MdoB-like AlkP superfamily enzyme
MKKPMTLLMTSILLLGISSAQADSFGGVQNSQKNTDAAASVSNFFDTIRGNLGFEYGDGGATEQRDRDKKEAKKKKADKKKKTKKQAEAALRKRAEMEYNHRHSPSRWQ